MKRLLFILILIKTATIITAQPFTLKQVIDSISANHPVIKMYDSEIRSMDEAAKGARSWMPPQIGAGQLMTPYNVNLWKKNGDMKGMGSTAISVEQMFPNKKKLDADEAYMSAMSSPEKENKKASLNELVQDAKRLYYDWIILEKKLVVVKDNEKLLDFMIRNAEIRYKNGLEKISAYYKAKAALGTTKNMQFMYENDIREKRIRLNALMYRLPTAPLDIDTNYVLKSYSSLVFDSLLFYQNRSDLRSIDKQMDVNRLKVTAERQGLKPEFGARYENMVGYGGQPVQYTAMIMMKIPFVSWAARMNKANIQSLKWKNDALQAQKEMMANEYSGMAYSMRNEFELNKKQLKLYEETIIPALQNNYRSMQLGYEQNTEELFMLFDAWEKLNMTQLEYFEILTKALSAQVALDRLLEFK